MIRSRLLFGPLTVVAAVSAAAAAPVDPSPSWTKVLAPDGSSGDHFGVDVSICGATMAVGASNDDDGGPDAGAVYVFDRATTGGWTLTQKLIPQSTAAGDSFGKHLVLQDDRLVVSALSDDSKAIDAGAVYVFERISGVWTEVAKFTATDGTNGDIFGDSISADGDRIVIGAPHDDQNGFLSGSAYIFERSAQTGSWIQNAKLLPSDPAVNDRFGAGVAVSGDTVVVGSFLGDDHGTDSGAAYVFRSTPSGDWIEHQKLTADDATAGAWFGASMSIDGDCLAIGAYKEGGLAQEAGAVYLFQRNPSSETWRQSAKVTASDSIANAWFGTAALVRDDTVWIGTSGSESALADTGSVYRFDRDSASGLWSQVEKLTPQDGSAGDLFGRRVALDADTLVVPSVFDDENGVDSGSVYVVDLEPSFIGYGAGCPGTGGIVPELCMGGYAAPGGTVEVGITSAVGGGVAFLMIGAKEGAIPMGFGCTLSTVPVLAGPFGPFPLFPIGATGPGAGSLSFPGAIPWSAPPVPITIQAFIQDAGAPGGFANTGGVKMMVQ